MRTTLKIFGLTSAAVVAATFAVFAQSAPTASPDGAGGKRGGMMAACRADMKALCGSVERGRGAKMQCLVENKTKASAECQAVMAAIQARVGKGAVKEARKQVRQACRSDVQAHCGAVEKGSGGVMRCLRQNETKVSPACSQALAALPMRKRDRTGSDGGQVPTPPTAPAAPKVQ